MKSFSTSLFRKIHNFISLFLQHKKLTSVTILSNEMNLDGNGERVDIVFSENVDYDKFDIYQKSHYKRYLFASKIVSGTCGDFACGTGYGSVMLSSYAKRIIGADINEEVITTIKKRYSGNKRIEFKCFDILNLNYLSKFDAIVSFETIEHFNEHDILMLFRKFYSALKPSGILIFSTPFMQEDDEIALNMGFHKTFFINELKIISWLNSVNFSLQEFKYQNYDHHDISEDLEKKDFIICVAKKV